MKHEHILIPLISVLALLGLIFTGLLVHEGVHVAQSKEPTSICYSYQQETWGYVLHGDDMAKDFATFKAYSEKWAEILEKTVPLTLSLLLGALIGYNMRRVKK